MAKVDVTVVDTLASSYTPTTSVTPCGAAEEAATRKIAEYAEIIQSHIFVPIAIETLGPINMVTKTISTYPNFKFDCL